MFLLTMQNYSSTASGKCKATSFKGLYLNSLLGYNSHSHHHDHNPDRDVIQSTENESVAKQP